MNSPEFQILLQSVRLDDKEKSAANANAIIKNNIINWGELYERADLHQVKPQLVGLINRLPSPVVPEDFKARINNAYRENLYLQLSNTAEFIRIKEMLDANGIMAVPYKGFWFANEYYGNLADRESVDIDLYIHFSDLDKIIALMPLLGYRAETSSSEAFIKKVKKESAELNFDKFEGTERIYHVEYHWQTGSTLHGLNISLDELTPQIITGKLQSREFPVFSHTANLLLAIMHHGGKDALLQMKQVTDIGFILKKTNDIDWQWILKTARRYNMERLVFVAVRLASVITGITVPEDLNEHVRKKVIKSLTDKRIRLMRQESAILVRSIYGSDHLYFHLCTRSGWKIKLRFVISKCSSRIKGFLIPRKLIDFYLKKRYNIER